jgi:phosphoribosylanthranilate isomerase
VTAPRVKVCGITRREDAELAVRLGAAAIGFVFWPSSPRVIAPEAARAIGAGLPSLVVRVGVFVNAPVAEVARVAREAGLDAVQLHGDEDVSQYASVPARVIKAVTAESDADVASALALPPHVTPLVDAHDPELRGGTGRRARWTGAAAIASQRGVILAGGLVAGNVADAIAAVRPWALDVSSGVEDAPGIKSAERLEAFFAAVRDGRGPSSRA